jgi:hypothetical protein
MLETSRTSPFRAEQGATGRVDDARAATDAGLGFLCRDRPSRLRRQCQRRACSRRRKEVWGSVPHGRSSRSEASGGIVVFCVPAGLLVKPTSMSTTVLRGTTLPSTPHPLTPQPPAGTATACGRSTKIAGRPRNPLIS